ncbi:glycosyltransferase family 4 protein [Deinococcus enclensis]|uniref:Glycosyltransferase involved in cell wall biosynthesis n=1 Tax=Deinococcus enclensis TaxID=1049582 RepID=A0ABT9MBL0_9DEIO|nr:glycosyltransferase family 4 protein [Deinococcus enclensis]MDP9763649.1 glycosyltransferase involved in cell wall biosynthesis [Deinococcus enclensis]
MTDSPAPLSVAFITDAPRVAGSEVWLLDVLPRLTEAGIRSTVFLSAAAPLDELTRRFTEAGVPVERYSDLLTLPGRTGGFDLRVLQAWYPGNYRMLLPRLASPCFVISHDQLDFHYPQPLRASYLEAYPWTKAAPFRRADGVMTVSHWAGAFIRDRMRVRDVQVVTNGVKTDVYRPATPEERQGLRAKHEFKRFTVLVPGRFAPEKNQLASVLAARHVPDLDFVFTGDMDSTVGTLAQALKNRLRLGNVRFLGRRWDMPELYRAADVLLQPTLAENQSLVTLEAMSSALPIVTTPIPAQAELVKDGLTGLLVPAQPRLLATALQALAAHPERARQLGLNARQFVLDHHTIHHTAARAAEVLRAIARR